MGKWKQSYEGEILKLLPINGSEVRAKEIYRKAKFHPKTVQTYLERLEEKGIVKRIQKSYKTVYYKRCEDARIEKMIDDFAKEISDALQALPRKIEDKPMPEGLSTEERNMIYRWKEGQLKARMIATLLRKIHKIFTSTFPEPMKPFEHYVGAFHDGIHVVPRDYVDKALKLDR